MNFLFCVSVAVFALLIGIIVVFSIMSYIDELKKKR